MSAFVNGASLLAAVQSLEYVLNISVGKRLLDMFGQVSCASGALAAFRRRALTQVGGLDTGPGEDLDLTLRLRYAGWKVRFADKAWCLTDVPQTPRGFVRQRLRWERDALRLRLRKHRRSVDPRDISASMKELLHQLEFLLTHLGATLAFPLYLIWLLYNFGSGALTVLMAVTLVYAGLDVIAVLCALVVVDRAGLGRLLPYLPLYGPFHAYLLRTIRLIAYVQEWVFDASRRDRYVPMRVAKKVPLY
jgi:cellulose synthase/poly-beta-1,6-N-acetylglucosamine synthase-like glycosyltransferase